MVVIGRQLVEPAERRKKGAREGDGEANCTDRKVTTLAARRDTYSCPLGAGCSAKLFSACCWEECWCGIARGGDAGANQWILGAVSVSLRARRLTGCLGASMRGERFVAGYPVEACFKMACRRFAHGQLFTRACTLFQKRRLSANLLESGASLFQRQRVNCFRTRRSLQASTTAGGRG